MSSVPQTQFAPNYNIPPGEILLDTLEAIGMSQAELAERAGRPRKTINEIINGKSAITPDTALQLERVLSIPASFWNNLERNYQEALAKLAEEARLQQHVAWLKELPLNELIKKGWIRKFDDKVQQLQEILNYFGVATPELWKEKWLGAEVAFRESPAFKSHPACVSAWLRRGQIDAQKIQCQSFDAGKFKTALAEIRSLTTQPPKIFQREMERLCAEAGVAVVFVPELPKVRVSGATWWMGGKAVIQLSLRYKSDDQLWFSFFHEAGHILLHGKRDYFIEDSIVNDKEDEANRFAGELLIPQREFQSFIDADRFTKYSISKFATHLGIAPGIVVGRLQHDKHINHSYCNELKKRLDWVAS